MADAPNPALQVATQLKELWGRQPKRRKTLAILVVLGVIGVVAFTQLVNTGERWAILSDGASPDDSQELYTTLQSRNVPTRLREGKVEVASDRLDEARAIASSAGLPRGGKGFELFDGSSLGQSSFTEQVNYRRALQGELARSITALAQVQAARVHLALGKRSVFKDQDEAASASVALHLHAGQTLSAEQVRGVRQLVAASVEGLKADAVVLVDQHGNLLDSNEPGQADRKADIERTLTAHVRMMLERVVGAGKVSVVTTAVVDDRKVSETQELYDQEHPVLRSEARTIEGGDISAGIGGVAGARGNLPGAPVAGATGGSAAGNQRLQETKNYEVSRTVRQTTKPDVQLQRIHVAIVVDQKAGPDGKPMPRSDKELAELTSLARQAAGIDDARGDKIEVHSIAFAPDPEVAAAPLAPTVAELPIVPIAIGGGLLLVFLTLIVVAARKRGRKKSRHPMSLALPAPLSEIERALDARPSLELEAQQQARGLAAGQPVRERVLEFVRNDAERAAEVLTAWLSESAPRGGAAPRAGAKP